MLCTCLLRLCTNLLYVTVLVFKMVSLQITESHHSVLSLYRGLSGVLIEHVGINEFHGAVDVGILSGEQLYILFHVVWCVVYGIRAFCNMEYVCMYHD